MLLLSLNSKTGQKSSLAVQASLYNACSGLEIMASTGANCQAFDLKKSCSATDSTLAAKRFTGHMRMASGFCAHVLLMASTTGSMRIANRGYTGVMHAQESAHRANYLLLGYTPRLLHMV